MNQFTVFVIRLAHDIGKVLPLKAHAEDIVFPF